MLRVVAGERPARPEAMSDELWGLVTAAWAQNFQDRPAIDDVIASMKVLVAPKKYKFTLPPIPPPGPDDGLRAIVLYDYEVWQAHSTDVCITQRSLGRNAPTRGHSPQEGRDHHADYRSRRRLVDRQWSWWEGAFPGYGISSLHRREANSFPVQRARLKSLTKVLVNYHSMMALWTVSAPWHCGPTQCGPPFLSHIFLIVHPLSIGRDRKRADSRKRGCHQAGQQVLSRLVDR